MITTGQEAGFCSLQMLDKSFKLARSRFYLKDKYTAGGRGEKKQSWLLFLGFICGSDHLKSYHDAAQLVVLFTAINESENSSTAFCPS